MSKKNLIEKLLNGIEVEWKALGEVFTICRGKRLVKSQLKVTGAYAVFQNCMTPLGYYHESNVKADTTFIISAGAAGEIGYSDVDFWAADDVYFFITPEFIESKFLYYFLLTQQSKITGQVRRASIPRLSKSAFEKMQIPIPPLPVQTEIVRILDTFTELTAELTDELTARKKQYTYYRDQLLTFEEGEVEWKTLGDEFDVRDGTHDSPKRAIEGKPLITSKNIKNGNIDLSNIYLISDDDFEKVNKRSKVDKYDVLISMIGTVGEVAVIKDEPDFAIKNVGLIKTNGDEVKAKYVTYYLTSAGAHRYMASTQNGSAQMFLSLSMLRKFPIPIPPLEEQERVVAILDKFDALTSSITEGLPREIELRKQQYEYYREKLLSFPKPEVTQ